MPRSFEHKVLTKPDVRCVSAHVTSTNSGPFDCAVIWMRSRICVVLLRGNVSQPHDERVRRHIGNTVGLNIREVDFENSSFGAPGMMPAPYSPSSFDVAPGGVVKRYASIGSQPARTVHAPAMSSMRPSLLRTRVNASLTLHSNPNTFVAIYEISIRAPK